MKVKALFYSGAALEIVAGTTLVDMLGYDDMSKVESISFSDQLLRRLPS